MRLVIATDEFSVGGISYPGFPILLNGDGSIVEPASLFLLNQCLHRGAVESVKTWGSYGYALLAYFRFLEQSRDYVWDRPSPVGLPSSLSAYRTWARSNGDVKATINLRLDVVARFYKFALKHGWVSELPFDIEDRKVSRAPGSMGYNSRTSGHRSVVDVKYRTTRPKVKVLTAGEVDRFKRAFENRVHSLMARFQLCTGIRVGELVSFPCKYVVDPRTRPDVKKMFAVALVPTEMFLKGGVERTIHIPRSIMAELWAYKSFERQQRGATNEVSELFVTEEGKAFESRGVWKIYKCSAGRAGLKVWPHLLRHTYATHTLCALARVRNIGNALIYVKDRLGHSSVKTTEIYLHYIDDIADSIMDAYQGELSAELEALSSV